MFAWCHQEKVVQLLPDFLSHLMEFEAHDSGNRLSTPCWSKLLSRQKKLNNNLAFSSNSWEFHFNCLIKCILLCVNERNWAEYERTLLTWTNRYKMKMTNLDFLQIFNDVHHLKTNRKSVIHPMGWKEAKLCRSSKQTEPF